MRERSEQCDWVTEKIFDDYKNIRLYINTSLTNRQMGYHMESALRATVIWLPLTMAVSCQTIFTESDTPVYLEHKHSHYIIFCAHSKVLTFFLCTELDPNFFPVHSVRP